MRIRRTGFLNLTILLLVIASFSACNNRSSDSDINHLLCHISVADITPEEPVYLAGFANRKGTSESIHRPLLTQCIVLKSNQEQVCIIVNDLMEVSPASIQKLIDAISGSTGFSGDHIFIHQTHTHSAPIMDEMGLAWSEANERYRENTLRTIEDNAIQTIMDTLAFIPCRIKTGSATCKIGINRRAFDPATGEMVIGESATGFFDPEVGILQLSDKDNNTVVTLFNYACHPVTLGYKNLAASPDFVGEARSIIEKVWGGTAVFLNGAAGDVNPINGLGSSTLIADQEGSKLGNIVTQSKLIEDSIVCLITSIDSIMLPYRDRNLTPDMIRDEVTRKCEETTEFITWEEDVKKWGKNMIKELEEDQLPENRIIKTGGIRIGSTILAFSQGEIFNEYHTRLKHSFPERMILFAGYTNGESGYLPDKQAFEEGGYEVNQAYIYLGEPSPLLPASDSIFSKKMSAFIHNLL